MAHRIIVTQNKFTGELTFATARKSGQTSNVRLKEVPDVPLHADKRIGARSITYRWSVKDLDQLNYTKPNIISG